VAADAHLARLADGCATLGLAVPDLAAGRRMMVAALAKAPHGRVAVRLTLTAGSGGRGLERPAALRPRMFAMAAPAPAPQGPARLATSAVRRNEGSPTSRLKTLAYLDNVLARREAVAAGADEALMLNGAGEVACASAANLFWIDQGRLLTPRLACGVLAGVVRAQVLAAGARLGVETQEVRAGRDALRAADGVFLTSSLIGVRAACRLDGEDLPAHRLVEALAQAVNGP
jgi:branched-chain amino acid aminotransferase/4-amino-4-deoxychorismate lyase